MTAARRRVARRAPRVRGHPRHVVLFSLAAGLGLGPVSPVATIARGPLRRGRRSAERLAPPGGRQRSSAERRSPTPASPRSTRARCARCTAGTGRGARWCSSRSASTARTRPRGSGSTASASRRWPASACRTGRLGRRRLDRSVSSRLARGGAGGRRSPGGSRRWTSSTRSRGGAGRMRRWRWTGCGGPARGGVGWPGRSTGCGGGRRWGSLAGCRRRRRRCCAGWCSGRTSGCRRPCGPTSSARGSRTLLAVSGQNVVLLAMLALGGGMVAGIGLRARLALALALVVVYVPLAGGGPSIQRAGVMGGAGLVAALAGRPASRWYALGLAAAATLALNPRASRASPGGSCRSPPSSGCSRWSPRWREGLRRAGLPGPVADAAAVTAAATVATAPLMALPLRAGLARLAAGQPRRRGRGRAGDVARDGRRSRSRRSRPRCARR